MTSTRIEKFAFSREALDSWSVTDLRHTNWPVVYTLDNSAAIYVGETGNAAGRMRQHLDSISKADLEGVRVILDETFNKSACLDLESYLIRLFAGDGKFEVRNRNEGITDAQYYQRDTYRRKFEEIFIRLRADGFFDKSIPEIENDDLFKLSPFKALTDDQAGALENILEGIFHDVTEGRPSTAFVIGEPGTGKTILAIYLMKLLRDIQFFPPDEDVSGDSAFSDFFVEGNRELLTNYRIGLVIPQQSLRDSVRKVFKKTPGLSEDMILTPFEVGESAADYDLLVVDEAHRLTQYAAQAHGTLVAKFRRISQRLFGEGWESKTQLDWIRARSRHQVFMLDIAQRVRPEDAGPAHFQGLLEAAQADQRRYYLQTQMRVAAGGDYVGYVRNVLAGTQRERIDFGEYDVRFFDDFDEMYDQIQKRESEAGLSRLVAGYAWDWRSRKDKQAYDIELGSHKLRWNSQIVDWINSPKSRHEVGSIHTVQGYDLNYAGVIIGRDLRYDPEARKMVFHRPSYFDKRGKRNNNMLGIRYTDDDLLEFVRNIYAVLLTRGMKGTYLYVCDDFLRERLRPFF